MHFVGEHAGQKLIRHSTPVYSQASGEKTHTLPTIWLKLERGRAPEWAAQLAAENFRFSMRPTPGAIGGSDIPVAQWCVYVDTVEWAKSHGYDDKIRAKADEILGGSPDLMKIDPPVLRPPWPKYDSLTITGGRTAEKVAARHLETADEIGVTVDELIAYESATLKRDAVIAAFEQALAERTPEPDAPAILIEA